MVLLFPRDGFALTRDSIEAICSVILEQKWWFGGLGEIRTRCTADFAVLNRKFDLETELTILEREDLCLEIVAPSREKRGQRTGTVTPSPIVLSVAIVHWKCFVW